jgi:hypothetical protein
VRIAAARPGGNEFIELARVRNARLRVGIASIGCQRRLA